MNKILEWLGGLVKHYAGAMTRLVIYLLIACVGQSIAELASMTAEQWHALSDIQVYVLCAKIVMPGLMVVRAFIDSSMSDARGSAAQDKANATPTPTP